MKKHIPFSLPTLFMLVGVLLFALCQFMLNQWTPLMWDDFLYSFVFDATERGNYTLQERVASWPQLFQSIWNHHHYVNGRIVAHTWVQIALWIGKGGLWSLLNAMCLMSVAWLAYTLACPRGRAGNNLIGYGFTLALFWLLLPCPGYIYFYLTGSCGYMWAALLVLSFLYLWGKPHSRICMLLSVPLGILAGNTQEGITCGVGAALILCSLIRFRRQSWMQHVAVLAFLAGLLINITAPGLRGRMELQGVHAPFLESLLFRLVEGVRSFIRSLPYLIPTLCLLGVGIYSVCRQKKWGRSAFAIVVAVVCFAAVTYSMEVTPHALFGCFLFSFMTSLPVIVEWLCARGRMVRMGVACAMGAAVIGTCLHAGDVIYRNGEMSRHVLAELRRSTVIPRDTVRFEASRYGADYTVPETSILKLHGRAYIRLYGLVPYVSGIEQRPESKEILDKGTSLLATGQYMLHGSNQALIKLPVDAVFARIYGYVLPERIPSASSKWLHRARGWLDKAVSGSIFRVGTDSYAIVTFGPWTKEVRVIVYDANQKRYAYMLDVTRPGSDLVSME